MIFRMNKLDLHLDPTISMICSYNSEASVTNTVVIGAEKHKNVSIGAVHMAPLMIASLQP